MTKEKEKNEKEEWEVAFLPNYTKQERARAEELNRKKDDEENN